MQIADVVNSTDKRPEHLRSSISASAWLGIYQLLAAIGLPKPQSPCDIGGAEPAPIGWPDAEVAIVERDSQIPANTSWEIVKLYSYMPDAHLCNGPNAWARLLEEVRQLYVCRSILNARRTTGSRLEETVLHAMLKAGVPPPTMGTRILGEDGWVAYPDFTWPRVHLALEVDGEWWHGGRELHARIQEAMDDIGSHEDRIPSKVIQACASKALHSSLNSDARRSRRYALAGWHLMVITGAEVADTKMFTAVLEEVKQFIDTADEPKPHMPVLRLIKGDIA